MILTREILEASASKPCDFVSAVGEPKFEIGEWVKLNAPEHWAAAQELIYGREYLQQRKRAKRFRNTGRKHKK